MPATYAANKQSSAVLFYEPFMNGYRSITPLIESRTGSWITTGLIADMIWNPSDILVAGLRQWDEDAGLLAVMSTTRQQEANIQEDGNGMV